MVPGRFQPGLDQHQPPRCRSGRDSRVSKAVTSRVKPSLAGFPDCQQPGLQAPSSLGIRGCDAAPETVEPLGGSTSELTDGAQRPGGLILSASPVPSAVHCL